MATTIPYSEFVGSHDPFLVLDSTPQRISDLCAGLSETQLATSIEAGKWSIHQIVAHLADCELVFQHRARMMLFEDNPTLVAFNQDVWVNGWQREKERFDQTLERLRVLRESTVRLFRNTPEHELRRYGTHTERGVQVVGDYIVMIAGHDVNHLSQIEAIRESLQPA